MTAKTVAERSAKYRARQSDKLARYEAALREILAIEGWQHAEHRDIARTALGDGK